MAVIKLVEDYAVSQLRKDVRDSLMMTGEQAILLQLFHAGDSDATPCPQCGDDIYESPERGCTSCYGTMFNGGVRAAMKVWTLFTDHEVSEQLSQRGIYQPDQRSVQFESFPMVTEHDILVRVPTWDASNNPLTVEGYYILQKVQRRSLRTGNRAGQYSWDVVAQRAQVAELPSDMTGVTVYPIIGKTFEESAQLFPTTATIPTHAVVEPDVKVIYFPFVATQSGEIAQQPTVGATGVIFTQSLPAATWNINHTLGYEPDVSVIVDGEEVDAEIEYPNNSVVVINFGVPVAGTARLT